MADFHYTAKDSNGATVTGTITAENETGALRALDEKNLFPVAVTDQSAGARRQAVRRRVRSRDVGIMYGQLADLIGSGVPLLRALDSLVRSTVSLHLTSLLKEVRASVADGKSLTEAFRQFSEVFPPLHTTMVQAGERASFLEDVLRSLSVFIERLDELRSKVIGSLIYPLILAAVGLVVLVGALLFFVPRFEPLLGNTQMMLPTAVVFAMSRALRGFWPFLMLALGGGAVIFWGMVKSPQGQRLIERWRMRIPVVGTAMRMVAISRFCRILGTMLANGVPLLQALAISKDATGSPIMADHIAQAAENVRDGKTLAEPLRSGGMFPDQILAMITVAEESNRLDKVLLNIADTVERRTNRQVDQAVRLIEPLILCLVAAAIGFLALGLLLPIFTMASTLNSR